MRTVACVGVLLAASICAHPALAGDFSAPKLPPAADFWTGCYIGLEGAGSIGGGNGGGNVGLGALIGGQLGCNYQGGLTVVGVEGEGAWSSLVAHDDSSSATGATFSSTTNRWDADIAARIGYLYRYDILTYAKLGVAFGDFQYNTTDTSMGTVMTGSATIPGLLIGSGMEYMVTPQWFVQGELDFILFRPTDVTLSCAPAAACTASSTVSTTTEFEFLGKVGVAYKFM